MSSTQRAAVPETTRADDKLLTLQEVAVVVRVPVATLRYWRHLGTGASSDFAEPRGSPRGVLRHEHEHERVWPRG